MRRVLAGLFAPLVLLPCTSWGQEQVRPSNVAGRLFRPVSFQQRDYNVKAGPVSFRVTSDLRTEFNDNINLTDENKESDVIITPSITASAYWAITPYNAISLDAKFGYHFYLAHPELNDSASGFTINPGTDLSFDIYTGAFRINIHERPTLQQDPAGEPTLSNIPIFSRFVNTAGITVDWSLNRFTTFTASYDHTDFIATQSEFSFADFNQDQLASTLRLILNDALSVGPELAAASTRYRSGEKADAFNGHVGLFTEVLLTPYTRMRVAGGYQTMQFDSDSNTHIIFIQPEGENTGRFVAVNGGDPGKGDNSTYYTNLTITNQLSRYFLQSLAVSKEAQLGITSQSVDLWSARYDATWNVNSWLTLQGRLLFDDGEEHGSAVEEKFRRWGAAIATDFRLSRKLNLSLGYDFIRKDSEVRQHSYTRNLIFAEFHYAF